MITLTELVSRLDALEEALPDLRSEHPDEGEFWSAFAGQADEIEDAAGPHSAMVGARIDTMLARVGINAT